MKAITPKEIADLKSRNVVVAVYPRKKLVVVSGYQYFRLVKEMGGSK